jgi:Adenylate and Guanylate cyclase catalytic domain
MGEDEEATLRTLSSHRKFVDSLIEQHRGRFVNSAGDSVLAEFASVVNAVQCAVEIQHTLKAENAEVPPERWMQFRIGVNLGDVMVESEQIYGDGVNVAARLESLADPGGTCISISRRGAEFRCCSFLRFSHLFLSGPLLRSHYSSVSSPKSRFLRHRSRQPACLPNDRAVRVNSLAPGRM